mmetsp:Transcript_25878/g.63699  ORF Transcript_25878/g.63699 Transcript_25878/m.63699 type:complete len:222 (+) Transcript_25878:238-903(+)
MQRLAQPEPSTCRAPAALRRLQNFMDDRTVTQSHGQLHGCSHSRNLQHVEGLLRRCGSTQRGALHLGRHTEVPAAHDSAVGVGQAAVARRRRRRERSVGRERHAPAVRRRVQHLGHRPPRRLRHRPRIRLRRGARHGTGGDFTCHAYDCRQHLLRDLIEQGLVGAHSGHRVLVGARAHELLGVLLRALHHPALRAARCPVGGAPGLAAVVGDPRDLVVAGH